MAKLNGLIISPDWMAEAILDGRKTLIVKTRPFDISDKTLYLINQRKALGLVSLGDTKVLDLKSLQTSSDEHLITETIRDEWCKSQKAWCGDIFYAWPIIKIEKYEEPLKTNIGTDSQIIVSDVEITDAKVTTGKMDIALDITQEERLGRAAADIAKLLGIELKKSDIEAVIGSPEATGFILSGEISSIVTPKRISKSSYFFADNQVVYGLISLGSSERVDLWKFAERYEEHRISEEERKKRFPRIRKLWLTPIIGTEAFDEPRTYTHGSVSGSIAKGIKFTETDIVKVEFSPEDVKLLENARFLTSDFQRMISRFVGRQLRFLNEALDKDVINFLKSLPDKAKQWTALFEDIYPEESVDKTDSRPTIIVAKELLPVLQKLAGKLPRSKQKTDLKDAVTTLKELLRVSEEELMRGAGHYKFAEAEEVTAPIMPSGEKAGSEIRLSDVLPYIKPFMFRRNAATLVGGIANWKKTENDVDLLLKSPLDEDMEHVIRFRFGRMFPPEISNRISFLQDDDFGGPFTNHIELGDLWFIPRTHRVINDDNAEEAFAVIQMTDVAKAKDPLLNYPQKRGKRPATFQLHFRGKSLHGDLRMQVNDYLVGWTILMQITGKVPLVDEIKEAKRFARRFDIKGTFFSKPWIAPKGLAAIPKSKMEMYWLKVDAERYEPGEIGATAEEYGVLVRATEPGLRVQYGLQKSWSHEYFFTDDSRFSGRLFFRLLRGGGIKPSEEEEAESGRLTPAGETYWRTFWAKDLIPSVLNRRAVQTKSMPPDGYSAMPVSLEEVTPSEFRFWEAKGSEAKEIRDELVKSKFFRSENVKVVNNEFRRIVTKYYLDLGENIGKAERVKYAIAWQYWKGQRVVREAPSRHVWHLIINADGEYYAWALTTDPMENPKSLTGILRTINNPALMTYDGTVEPGQKIGGEVLNRTKATSSWIRHVDDGIADILEKEEGHLRVRFRGHLKGVYNFEQEEADSNFWMLQREGKLAKKNRDGRGKQANLFVDRDGDFAYVECPACSSLDLRKTDKAHTYEGGMLSVVECNSCKAEFAFYAEDGLHDKNQFMTDKEKTLRGKNESEDAIQVLMGEIKTRFNNTFRDYINGRDFHGHYPYVLVKAIPMRGGIQVWDPEKKDPDIDRSQLRPFAFYQPMKSLVKSSNEFQDRQVMVEEYATPGLLSVGIMVEPKYNGFRIVMEKKGNKTLIYTEDEQRDLSKVLPSLVAELKQIPGDFIVDGEGMAIDDKEQFIPQHDLVRYYGKKVVDDSNLRIPIFEILYSPDAGNVTAKTQIERRKYIDKFFRSAKNKLTKIFQGPFKIARNLAQLNSAIDWAGKQPGSDGVMLKGVEATYFLGGENDLWAKLNVLKPSEIKLVDVPFTKRMSIIKTKEERFILGVVLEPNDGSNGAPLDPDTQKDIYSKEEIRHTAHNWMEYYGNIGYMHQEMINDKIRVLESYVAPCDFEIDGPDGTTEKVREGSWLLAGRVINDILWKEIKDGDMTGWSIGGDAWRIPVKETT